ncbi:MAG: thiamine pyrophosphate-dependent enzyme [Thermodesulfobacteriota bacterium]|nr:thiamine pyrophosphate-dependent enzyme [Thermodesulfobacteriota bacterium]
MNREGVTRKKEEVYAKPKIWKEPPGAAMYCPGCQHPVIHRIVAEVLEEMAIDGEAVCILGVGCHAFIQVSWNLDVLSCAHGRALDSATAIKRLDPDAVVFTVQGDGDCTAIGAGAFLGAMSRGEKITTIMYNNTNYGTTGGQLAPTSLIGQKTTTTPKGRNPEVEGHPVHTAELAASFTGTVYSARGSVHSPANFQRTKKYMKKAFQKQINGVGFSFVEVLSACPPNWHLSPKECIRRIEEEIIPEFPLGEIKNEDDSRKSSKANI